MKLWLTAPTPGADQKAVIVPLPARAAVKLAVVLLLDCGEKPGALQNRNLASAVPEKLQATVDPRLMLPPEGVHVALGTGTLVVVAAGLAPLSE